VPRGVHRKPTRQAVGILVCLEHERQYRTDEHGFGFTLRALPAQLVLVINVCTVFGRNRAIFFLLDFSFLAQVDYQPETFTLRAGPS